MPVIGETRKRFLTLLWQLAPDGIYTGGRASLSAAAGCPLDTATSVTCALRDEGAITKEGKTGAVSIWRLNTKPEDYNFKPLSMKYDWTPERRSRLPELWAEGKSATRIAIELGFTAEAKDAVLGIVNRMNLPPRLSPIGKGRPEGAPDTKPRTKNTLPPLPPLPKQDFRPIFYIPPASRPAPIPLNLTHRLPASTARTCQYPMNEGNLAAGVPWLFCEAPSDPCVSYCRSHASLCYHNYRPRVAA